MDLELTPDQRDVATAFARVLARDSSIDRVRAAEDAGFDPALWKTLTGMGVLDIAAGQEDASGFVELALVAEEAGRRLACVPLVEAAVAARLLAETGTTAGDGIVVLAPRPAEGGVAVLTPAGAVADAVVALDGDELVLAHGPAGAPPGDLGFLAAADRTLRGADVDRRVLASGGRAHALWRDARDRWRLATAAACAGMAAQALDIAVRYATERHQFGVPIGSFQAIAHPLADVAMAGDGARLVAREAAWRHDHGLASWRAAAAVAFAHAAETAVRAGELCLHVHGGYGYTLEYDAQLYLRRAKATRLLAGDPDALWEEIGAVTIGGDR